MASGRVSKSWGQRLTIAGRRTNLGLGRYPVVTLAEARRKAIDNLRAVEAGRDPRGERLPTFMEAADKVMAIHAPTWKNPARVGGQWRQTFRDYVYPVLGRKRVDRITTGDVLDVLTPIWSSKPAVAKIARRRIAAVMKWAVAKGYRGDNPAGSAISAALPNGNGKRRHHKAVPHGDTGAVLEAVAASAATASVRLAFRFLVLTAARTADVRGACRRVTGWCSRDKGVGRSGGTRWAPCSGASMFPAPSTASGPASAIGAARPELPAKWRRPR